MARLFWLVLLLSDFVWAQGQSPVLLFRDVSVIDGIGDSAHDHVDLRIRGDRIEEIAPHKPGPLPSLPSGVRVIEAGGKFIIPGLWDMHVHIWDADRAFPLFLANGITGVRNTGGHPEDLSRWRAELKEGRRLGPRIIACGPVVDGPPPIHPDHSVVVESVTQARSLVDDLDSEGWDCIKVYDNVSRDAYFAIAAEAKKERIALVGHVPVSVTAMEASNAGQKSIEHLEGLDYAISPVGDRLRRDRLERIGKPLQSGEMMKMPMRITNEINLLANTYDETRAADLFSGFVKNGTWLVPTLCGKQVYASIGDLSLYHDSRLKYVDRQERNGWEHNPIVHLGVPEYVAARKRALQEAIRITRAAHKAGVRFLAGTDSGGVPYLYYGFSLHDELVLLVDSGFTAMQALQAATRDSAEFLGLRDSGTIERGKRADLVLLAANPLADIRNTKKIEAVVTRGHLLARDDLVGLLQNAEVKSK